ncbi:MAG TPA: NAD-dependent epimerase/dehydratase family protein [Thermoanaerobaculia bacterium]|nr:NAD-dependent epimerase/dehydratase family protein [Thermoanaerobaculia bacterium]
MKIFITGATGYIGQAVAEAISAAGNEVLALAHRPGAAEELRGHGWTPVGGDLRKPETLAAAVAAADGAIHTANTNADDAGQADRAAVSAMLGALAGSGKPFVYTSGVWVLGDTGGGVSNEGSSTANALPKVAWRAEVEKRVLAAAEDGVRSVVLRPGIVYGHGGGIPAMLAAGKLPLVGDGEQHWTTVHVDDLADLYLLALTAPAGTVLHGISGEVTMGELAAACGVVERVSAETARERFGGFGDALALDQRISAERSREVTGWEPGRPGILDEGARG